MGGAVVGPGLRVLGDLVAAGEFAVLPLAAEIVVDIFGGKNGDVFYGKPGAVVGCGGEQECGGSSAGGAKGRGGLLVADGKELDAEGALGRGRSAHVRGQGVVVHDLGGPARETLELRETDGSRRERRGFSFLRRHVCPVYAGGCVRERAGEKGRHGRKQKNRLQIICSFSRVSHSTLRSGGAGTTREREGSI